MKQREVPRFNLQFFAEQPAAETSEETPAGETPAAEATGEGVENADNGGEGTEKEEESGQDPEKETQKEKTYDEKFLQKLQEESKSATEKAVEEALKLAAMTPEEKGEYEKSQKEQQLVKREQEIALRELQADTKELLVENKLSANLLDIVIGRDLEETRAKITSFRAEFDKAVQEKVVERMKGKTPSTGTGNTGMSAATSMSAEVDKYLK